MINNGYSTRKTKDKARELTHLDNISPRQKFIASWNANLDTDFLHCTWHSIWRISLEPGTLTAARSLIQCLTNQYAAIVDSMQSSSFRGEFCANITHSWLRSSYFFIKLLNTWPGERWPIGNFLLADGWRRLAVIVLFFLPPSVLGIQAAFGAHQIKTKQAGACRQT